MAFSSSVKQNLVVFLADMFNVLEINPVKCVRYPGADKFSTGTYTEIREYIEWLLIFRWCIYVFNFSSCNVTFFLVVRLKIPTLITGRSSTYLHKCT